MTTILSVQETRMDDAELKNFFGWCDDTEVTLNGTFGDLGSIPTDPPISKKAPIKPNNNIADNKRHSNSLQARSPPKTQNMYDSITKGPQMMGMNGMGSFGASPLMNGMNGYLGSPLMSQMAMNASPQMFMFPHQQYTNVNASPYTNNMMMFPPGAQYYPGAATMVPPMRAKVPLDPATKRAVDPPPVKEKPSLVLPESMTKEFLASTAKRPKLKSLVSRNLSVFLQETDGIEYENTTVMELKRILKDFDLNAIGKKNELISRIRKIRATYIELVQEDPKEPVDDKDKETKNDKRVKGDDKIIKVNESADETNEKEKSVDFNESKTPSTQLTGFSGFDPNFDVDDLFA